MTSDSSAPTTSIVVPTRARPDYLRVALASIAPQATSAEAELIVLDDAGPSEQIRMLAERFGARYEPHPRPLGLNVARNKGVALSTGELVVFVDDDVEVCEGWLGALLLAAREHPRVDVLTGPIVPRLEGSPPHSCGREAAPITALDLGPLDRDARYAWGANMAIRRSALERIGPFDVALEHGGDEQEWQDRYLVEPREDGSPSAPVFYVAGAALYHRRSAADARLRSLCRAARVRGRAARRFDEWQAGTAGGGDARAVRSPSASRKVSVPSLPEELRTLAGCLWHVLRRRCPAGLVMVAHSAGRVEQAVSDELARAIGRKPSQQQAMSVEPRAQTKAATNGHPPDDFLSGESGTVGGLDALRRAALDQAEDALELVRARRLRLDSHARHAPTRQRVSVFGLERPEHRALADNIRAELTRSRHAVQLHFAPPGERGKFENLNALLNAHPLVDSDWLLVVDDDIVLPRGFLDRFLFLADRFRLDLAQPAHRRASHAAWQVTRRHANSVVRETSFVEIGPVTAFARSTFDTLLPFPNLRMGWGLDLHWAALAREHHWRCGVVDATPISHRAAPAGSAYSRAQAIAEARMFLGERPYVSATEAQRTLVTHRHW